MANFKGSAKPRQQPKTYEQIKSGLRKLGIRDGELKVIEDWLEPIVKFHEFNRSILEYGGNPVKTGLKIGEKAGEFLHREGRSNPKK